MDTLGFIEGDMYFGLYLCVNGRCEMVVNDQLCCLCAGDAMVKSPLVQISEVKEYEGFEMVPVFEDEIAVLAPITDDNMEVVHELLRQNKFYYSSDEREQKLLLDRKRQIDERKNELESMDASCKSYKVISRIIALLEQATILEFARMFMRNQTAQPEEMEKERKLMIQFTFLLFQHYKTHRQVQFYADTLNVSPNHFTRMIKKVSHRTPSEWISLLTINQAKKLLCRKQVSIKEVAQELNFPEQFTFRKYFKLYTGVSPKEYKLKHTKV
jgi:AraC-like DNA-binding protein